MSKNFLLNRTCHLVLAIILFWGIKNYLPISDSIGAIEQKSVQTGLAILALVAVLWLTEALPLAVTALLIPILATLLGIGSVSGNFSGFAHPLIFLFLGGFGLAAALSTQGLDRWIAIRIVSLGRGNFNSTAIIVFIVSALLSMWISNTATVALLLPVALGLIENISRQCGKIASDKVAPYLLLGLAYSASIGGIGTLIGTPPNAIAAGQLNVTFSEWLGIGIPCVIILLPTLIILLKVLLPVENISQLEVNNEEFHFDSKKIQTAIIFILAIVGWVFSAQLSTFFAIDKAFDTIVAISAVILLSSLRLVKWTDIDRTTDWGVLLLFGGGITLSRILSSTGASQYLASQINTLTHGWPILFIVGLIVLFVIFLTEFSSNTASTALLVPIFAAASIDMGLAPTQLILPLTVAASCAFMLPVATPPNAIVFGSGRINQFQMIKVGMILNISFAILLTMMSQLLF